MSTTTQDTAAGSAAESASAEITGSAVDGFKTHQVELSETAAEKVSSLLQQEGREDLRLRVAVQPGGCSGLIYQLYFDERVLDGDALRDFSGVEVVVDKMSVPYLEGAKIDFEDSISKQGFTIDNPNAGGSCACGDSFH
ncbi:iron-sulfur cluster assembly accessory protein [Nesterenkonia sp. E16_7]|uniref:HesB/IscA family protein n=1 Tax=unclassified Nesterenkonia TaxID=2629769 RepID=UPI001A92C457|nr:MULTISPECIES: iron-sulfur cluster assembly accessory protein [unclassified Nesterenkonia]MBO0595145.1 iron-sulfur cluster assembly accessory protein [Nesterenkonia sp. E16_10]MBO0599687.1 iron-sulfur cluster assembly accessory protein [Nesterenkonia sp. E16_7]